MIERLHTRKNVRKAGALVALGTAAAILTGCTNSSGETAPDKSSSAESVDLTQANADRNVIAGLYQACKIVKVERDPKHKAGIYSQANGYEAPVKITADITVSDKAEQLRQQYDKDDTVRWSSQSVRLDFFNHNGDSFQQRGPRSNRPEDLPTQSGRDAFYVFPSGYSRDHNVIVPYLGNSAETDDGAVTAATPCGAIERVHGEWEQIQPPADIHAFGPVPIDHLPSMPWS